jgi:hypothetical protein
MLQFNKIIKIIFICGLMISCKLSNPFSASRSNLYSKDSTINVVKFDTTSLNIFDTVFYKILKKTFPIYSFVWASDSSSLKLFNIIDTIYFEKIDVNSKLKMFFKPNFRDSQSVFMFQSYIEPSKSISFFLLKVKKNKLAGKKSGDSFKLTNSFNYYKKKGLVLYFISNGNNNKLFRLMPT